VSLAVSPSIPDFETALEQFRAFIAQVGHTPNGLLWVFREDVSTHRRRILIKVPLPGDNERVAKARYDRGRQLGLGVCLEGFCRLGPALCCTTWYVEDLEESGRRLCRGLKLCVPCPADLVTAWPVRNRLVWTVRRWLDDRSRFNQVKNLLPTRHEHPPSKAGDRP
jgi:hypothetical protein